MRGGTEKTDFRLFNKPGEMCNIFPTEVREGVKGQAGQDVKRAGRRQRVFLQGLRGAGRATYEPDLRIRP